MPDLGRVAVEAQRLQNGYALAVDTRDWEFFATLFTEDVLARYPNRDYHGMDDWLGDFVPFHAGYPWSSHSMTTHVVGEDEAGFWATCYGFVQWTTEDSPGVLNRLAVFYRDRLAADGDGWLIARRTLNVLRREPVPVPAAMTFPHALEDLRDFS